MPRLRNALLNAVAARGFEVRRHPAARRQKMFDAHGVDLVLDVGASDGGYGRQLRQFGYDGRIVSFEPLSDAFARLSAHIADDPLWSARNCALGEEAGAAEINIASNSASSSLLPMQAAHREAEPSVGYVGTETIAVQRLDDLIDDLAGPDERVFLKIDTQGFERQVLAGGPKAVARCVGLQLELSFVSLYEGGMLVDEALATAYGAGFHLAVIEQGWAAPTGQMLQADGIFFRD